jgi:hypothetical protein
LPAALDDDPTQTQQQFADVYEKWGRSIKWIMGPTQFE